MTRARITSITIDQQSLRQWRALADQYKMPNIRILRHIIALVNGDPVIAKAWRTFAASHTDNCGSRIIVRLDLNPETHQALENISLTPNLSQTIRTILVFWTEWVGKKNTSPSSELREKTHTMPPTPAPQEKRSFTRKQMRIEATALDIINTPLMGKKPSRLVTTEVFRAASVELERRMKTHQPVVLCFLDIIEEILHELPVSPAGGEK